MNGTKQIMLTWHETSARHLLDTWDKFYIYIYRCISAKSGTNAPGATATIKRSLHAWRAMPEKANIPIVITVSMVQWDYTMANHAAKHHKGPTGLIGYADLCMIHMQVHEKRHQYQLTSTIYIQTCSINMYHHVFYALTWDLLLVINIWVKMEIQCK